MMCYMTGNMCTWNMNIFDSRSLQVLNQLTINYIF